jgi:YVTN family beta-propeller protein
VNKISNSVSVVDLKNNAVIATLQTRAEPADVVFTGSAGSSTNPARAYVSVAQAREIEVFDPLLLGTPLSRIPILGQQPRALAVGPNGSGGHGRGGGPLWASAARGHEPAAARRSRSDVAGRGQVTGSHRSTP